MPGAATVRAMTTDLISIHETVWRAPSAQVYGRVSVDADSSLWPNSVIRAECQEVRIGKCTNIQDFVMIHVGYDNPTIIGDRCSVTHHATVHGAVVEDDCLIGINAVVMDGAVIGRGSIVAPGAVVREGTVVPPHSIVAGVPAKVLKTRDSTAENRMNAWQYQRNAEAYRREDHRAWDGPEYDAFFAARKAELEKLDQG
jgi:carbonic anhydrase/acetyltransferase-like protein (isoleucine patch superfamily)